MFKKNECKLYLEPINSINDLPLCAKLLKLRQEKTMMILIVIYHYIKLYLLPLLSVNLVFSFSKKNLEIEKYPLLFN